MRTAGCTGACGIKLILLIACLFISSCAPMPQPDKMFKGVQRLTPLEDVELIIHEVSLGECLWKCNKIAWEVNPILPILALGAAPACGRAWHDGKGGISKCEIWVPKGDKGAMKHELRHCQGMADRWY